MVVVDVVEVTVDVDDGYSWWCRWCRGVGWTSCTACGRSRYGWLEVLSYQLTPSTPGPPALGRGLGLLQGEACIVKP